MPIRVLALCGFTQNAHIFNKQLGAVRRTCKDVEFVFLDPPIVVQKADMPWNQNMSDFGSTANTEEEEQTPETTPRAWWLSNQDKSQYKGYEDTLRYIHEYLTSNPPFDGIMGFSQGACMAAIVAGLVEKLGFSEAFPAEPPIPKFKFFIAVGGFLPSATNPPLAPLFPLPETLPTLHIMGRNDVVVTPERSQTLVDGCLNKRVEMHEGGHFTPSKASWRHFFNAYISSFEPGGTNGDVPPPSSFGPSAANTPSVSGAATPRTATPPPPMTPPPAR